MRFSRTDQLMQPYEIRPPGCAAACLSSQNADTMARYLTMRGYSDLMVHYGNVTGEVEKITAKSLDGDLEKHLEIRVGQMLVRSEGGITVADAEAFHNDWRPPRAQAADPE